jgi:predicted HAD superfamily phosphohydrolase YqeG
VTRGERIQVATGASQLWELVAASETSLLIVDVEPFVLHWDSSPTEFASGVRRIHHNVASRCPSIERVIFASNAPRLWEQISVPTAPSIDIVSRARKPWRTSYLPADSQRITVIGDQLLTDGLLAWRLNGIFIHLQPDPPVPWWPRLQTSLGHGLEGVLFRPARMQKVVTNTR